MLYRIAFFSSSKQLLQEQELIAILDQFATTVDAFDIKGVFIYLNGSMLQMGEAELEKFEAFIDLLKSDPRQTYITILSKNPIEQRIFSRKYLFYKTLDAKNFSGLSEVISTVFSPDYGNNPDNEMIKIVTNFFQDNYRN
ncbi:BLUF domain-containing protein [Siphonobacter sp. SORGH_AS_1065]|uniref:BLUF domain-containing protein n=1 Tax=Siphonobacter sp. SORGH_AS_1065 TaxID=3041795 RepID=UPI00278437F4|nr:BLUF domain-containing protein [Siphonobacter sp. SORGH_AS_1065]MDQ1090138.1 hypothetical protein [Siphonobacter sp. SORGH_AS_1065]